MSTGEKNKADMFCVIQHHFKLCFHGIESDRLLHCDSSASACWRTESKQVQKRRPWPHQLEYPPYFVVVINLQLLTKGIINVLLQVVTDILALKTTDVPVKWISNSYFDYSYSGFILFWNMVWPGVYFTCPHGSNDTQKWEDNKMHKI